MILVYFYIASHKKILIRRSTIVVLPNPFRGSTEAPQFPTQLLGGDFRWARNYSSAPGNLRRSVENLKLNPWWVTGFVDAEGCFHVSITKNNKLNVGWKVQLFFEITLSKKDKALLEKIKNFFNANLISKHGPQSIQFRVQSIKELQKFLDHFAKYPLITNKCADF